jgi:hypothetical protein
MSQWLKGISVCHQCSQLTTIFNTSPLQQTEQADPKKEEVDFVDPLEQRTPQIGQAGTLAISYWDRLD